MADALLTQIPSPGSAAANTPTVLWWRTTHALRGVAASLIAFVIIQFSFVAHVHHDYEGKYHAPFLASYHFGLPQCELDHGQLPVCGGKQVGWDGQFYYHMAHDPFALDPKIAETIDTPIYRYQRIGIPLMAWSAARITGRTFTSAFLYHSVQIAVTSVGFGVLVGWLSAVGLPWGWSLCWLLGGGVFFSLFKGLPDAPADGMFIAAMVALCYRRLGWYSFFASLACLMREGYVVVAFIVFLATVFNRYEWEGSPGLLRRFFVSALPGMFVVGWMAYLCWMFQISPLSSERAPGGLYGLPFKSFLLCLSQARLRLAIGEVRWSIVSACVVTAVLVSGVMTARRSLVASCAVVYALLVACLGQIVWEDFCGHSKAAAGVAIFGILLLHFDQSSFRRAALQLVLVANLFVGLERNVIHPLAAPAGFREYDAAQAQLLAAGAETATRPQLPTHSDCQSKVVWVNAAPEYVAPCSWWTRLFHRSLMPLVVEVTNESSIPWLGNRGGKDAVIVGVQISDGARIVAESRSVLPSDVMPGETVRLHAAIPAGRPGERTLRIGLLQEGCHWFGDLGQKDVVEKIKIR